MHAFHSKIFEYSNRTKITIFYNIKQSFYLLFCPLSPDSTLKMFSKESKTIQRSASFSNMVSYCQNKNKIIGNLLKASEKWLLVYINGSFLPLPTQLYYVCE